MKELNGAMQESLVALLCYDKDSAPQIAALVDVKWYEDVYREIAQLGIKYLDEFKEPAGEHLLDLINGLIEKKPDKKDVYERYYFSLTQTAKQINSAYVLKNVSLFIRKQTNKLILQKALPLSMKDDETSIMEVENLLSSVGKVENELIKDGLNFNDPEQAIKFIDTKKELCLPSGIPPLDEMGLGPRRKASHITLGGYGKGKSFYCCHVGKSGIKAGYNVAHFSLEMDQDEIAWRYIQAFFAVREREARTMVTEFIKDELGRFVSSHKFESEPRPHLQQTNIKELLFNKVNKLKDKARLHIKAFPSGQMTVRMMKAYLDRLEKKEKFIPDYVIVDYLGIMKNSHKEKRDGIGQNMIDLTGLAQERNFALVTVHQLNREGNKTGQAKGTNVAEDISVLHTAQNAWVINQTEAEEEEGWMRIGPDKARHAKKAGAVIGLSQNFDIGQFCLDWMFVNDIYYKHLKKDD